MSGSWCWLSAGVGRATGPHVSSRFVLFIDSVLVEGSKSSRRRQLQCAIASQVSVSHLVKTLTKDKHMAKSRVSLGGYKYKKGIITATFFKQSSIPALNSLDLILWDRKEFSLDTSHIHTHSHTYVHMCTQRFIAYSHIKAHVCTHHSYTWPQTRTHAHRRELHGNTHKTGRVYRHKRPFIRQGFCCTHSVSF